MPPAVEARAANDYRVIRPRGDIPLGPDLAAEARGADAILLTAWDKLGASAIAALDPTVRIVASFSVGYEHIDLQAAAERGLIVTNTPDILTGCTADIAMFLILAACRRASEGLEFVRSGKWHRTPPSTTLLLGHALAGRRLGILGMGRIGLAVAARARAFGMIIHYHNRRQLAPGLEGDASYHASLDQLLRHSDVLSLHCPASSQTRGLIDAAALARLPAGAVLINAARGDLVDDEAVISALTGGQLAAAGLDVFANEPMIHPAYRALPNVFAMPHLGSATVETRNAMGFRALDNIDCVLAGRPAIDALAV
jgi:lactate dehydrogenase-like 2-hydroxyacid dehydrogenase